MLIRNVNSSTYVREVVKHMFLFLFLLEVEVINFTNHKDPDSPS